MVLWGDWILSMRLPRVQGRLVVIKSQKQAFPDGVFWKNISMFL